MVLNRLKSSSRLTRSGVCTNPESRVAPYTELCTVAPMWLPGMELAYLAPRIFRWFPDFWKVCAPLNYAICTHCCDIKKLCFATECTYPCARVILTTHGDYFVERF